MSFLFGSIVFFGGCFLSLAFLGANIGGFLGCVVAFMIGAKIGKSAK